MCSSTKESIIVCLTASYPYGTRETYFENELQYLSKAFDRVYILPAYNPTKSNVQREVPTNTFVLPIVVPQGIPRVLQGIFNLSPLTSFFQDFREHKVYQKKSHFVKWFNALLVFRIKYIKLRNLFKSLDPGSTLLYSYWGGPAVFVADLCKPYKKVIRMHGGDFYLNRNNGYLPLRKLIYASADLLLPISNDIACKLRTDYGITQEKIFLNYLGTDAPEVINTLHPDGTIRIVSCSNLFPLKRVDIIASTISRWKHTANIEWHHFGDGPEMEKIKAIVQGFDNPHVRIFFQGWASTETIYDFYRSHYITWLINVSKFEGVPVSIMEAFSFGIPAIATNAGATSEIVNESNGKLIDIEVNEEMLANCILSCNDAKYPEKRKNARLTWKEKFNAGNNYTVLTSQLKSLLAT